MKYNLRPRARLFTRKYFRSQVGNRPFSIISNDCWGGELYKLLDRPFNSPFIGLMIMGPCYIKLLQDPMHHLAKPLIFKKESVYPERKEKNAGEAYPLAVLGDSGIEIHFIHYDNAFIAAEKWNQRLKRIDWEHLFIKYDAGKDHSCEEIVEEFLKLPFNNKLLIGNKINRSAEMFVIKNYHTDAVVQFRYSLLHFNPVRWLTGNPHFKNIFDRLMCWMAFRYLYSYLNRK